MRYDKTAIMFERSSGSCIYYFVGQALETEPMLFIILCGSYSELAMPKILSYQWARALKIIDENFLQGYKGVLMKQLPQRLMLHSSKRLKEHSPSCKIFMRACVCSSVATLGLAVTSILVHKKLLIPATGTRLRRPLRSRGAYS